MFWTTGLLLQGAVIALFPEEVIITTLGLLWSQGKIPFFEAMIAIQVGLLPANAIMVTLGKYIGMPVLSRFPFSLILKPALIEAILEPIRAHSKKVSFFTRFIPSIRGPVYFSLGLSGFKISRFVLIDTLASFIQVPALLLLGRQIGKDSTTLVQAFQKLGLFFLGIVLTGVIIGVLFNRLRTEKAKTAVEVGIDSIRSIT